MENNISELIGDFFGDDFLNDVNADIAKKINEYREDMPNREKKVETAQEINEAQFDNWQAENKDTLVKQFIEDDVNTDDNNAVTLYIEQFKDEFDWFCRETYQNEVIDG